MSLGSAAIFRHSVRIDGEQHDLPIPESATILHVGVSGNTPAGHVDLWYQAFPERVSPQGFSRVFQVVGTGEPWPGDRWTYRGTAAHPSSPFVWHLLEVVP